MMRVLALLAAVFAVSAGAEEPPLYLYRPIGAFNLYLYQDVMGIPSSVAIDAKHEEVWVSDSGRELLGVFASNGISLFAFGSKELLEQPHSVVVAPNGEVLVLEGKRRGIRRFSYRGEYRGELVLERFESEPSIGAIAFDANGNLYVAENRTGQIFVYNGAGKLRFQFGSRGPSEGQFMSVVALAVAADGTVFVADQQGIPVQSFDDQGNFLTSWGRHDLGRDNFALPSGVAVNSKGIVVVSDELRHDVKTFDRNGKVVQSFGGQGRELGAFSFPTAVAIDAQDRLYVAERGNRRVQIFELVTAKRAQ